MGSLFGFVDYFFHFVNYFSLTGRAALMNTIVFIGIEFTIDVENPYFQFSLRDDFSIAVVELFGPHNIDIRQFSSPTVTC